MQSGEVYIWRNSIYDLAYVLEGNQFSQDGRLAWHCKRYKDYNRSNVFIPDRGRLGTMVGGGYYTEDGIVYEDHLNTCDLRNEITISI